MTAGSVEKRQLKPCKTQWHLKVIRVKWHVVSNRKLVLGNIAL